MKLILWRWIAWALIGIAVAAYAWPIFAGAAVIIVLNEIYIRARTRKDLSRRWPTTKQ